MRLVPFAVKYGLGKTLRKRKPPYSLVSSGSIVVQVGAPLDTLHAGRSRAMYFSLLTAPEGKVVIFEPDQESIREFERVAKRHGVTNAILCPLAAWCEERKALRVFVDDTHPATNFSEGTVEYSELRLKDFRVVEMPADTVDHVLKKMGMEKVDLISITTNGAEREVLKGMQETIAAGLPYICLARTGPNYERIMEEMGYQLYAHDDRGYTFQRANEA